MTTLNEGHPYGDAFGISVEDLAGTSSPVQQKPMGRREFLIGAGGALGGLIVGGAAVDFLKSTGNEKPGYNAEKLNSVVGEGLADKWNEVVVFPGFLVISGGAKFYSEPTLNPKSQIQLPLSNGARLGVLRPYFVDSSLDLHQQDLGKYLMQVKEAQPIPAGTLGFLDTVTSQFVYCNYAQDSEFMSAYVKPGDFSESEAPIGLTGDKITMDGRQKVGNMNWAYIKIKQPSDGNFVPDPANPGRDKFVPTPPTYTYKLCGVDLLYNSAGVANDVANNVFMQGIEPFTFPKENQPS